MELNHPDKLTRRRGLPMAIKLHITVRPLGSIQAFSDTVESKGRQMKQCRIKYFFKNLPILGLIMREETETPLFGKIQVLV